MTSLKQKADGVYYTERDVFAKNRVFHAFFQQHHLINATILEPFAGQNNLIKFLQKQYANLKYEAYDLTPGDKNVKQNDSLKNWIYGDVDAIITNPPYLAKKSATRLNLVLNFGAYDDLYKVCLNQMLQHCHILVAIIPASFIASENSADKALLRHLKIWQNLPDSNFLETEVPVALAYFVVDDAGPCGYDIYNANEYIGNSVDLMRKQEKILAVKNSVDVIFNAKNGNLVLITGDTSLQENIKFILGRDEELAVKAGDRYRVKTFVNCEVNEEFVIKLNAKIIQLRAAGCDYLWTPFKSRMKNKNVYRRRLKFSLARKIIQSVEIEK